MLNMPHLIDGVAMLDETLEQIEALTDREKLDLVKSALYSDDHLFKVLFRIALVVDPDNTEASAEWFKSRLPRRASSG